VVEAAAVGDATAGFMDLMVATRDRFDAPAAAYLASGVEGIDWPVRDTVRVPLIDVRELIDGVDLIKMDIEGSEHVILAALEPYVLAQRPIMLVEVRANTPALRHLIDRFCDACGYLILALAPDGVRVIARRDIFTVDMKRDYRTRDVVLATPDVAAEVFGDGMIPRPTASTLI
jgi:hypothetical protein